MEDIYSGILILLQICFFASSFFVIIRKEIFFGIYYFWLFIYAFPAEIGYWFYPELSLSMLAYFGESIWFDYVQFVTCSLVSFFIVFLFTQKFIANISIGDVVVSKEANFSWLAISIIVASLIVQIGTFSYNFENLAYGLRTSEGETIINIWLALALILFKLSVGHILAIYCALREKNRNKNITKILCVLFGASLILFFTIAIRIGNRTDVLALGMGIFVFEILQQKLQIKNAASLFAKFLVIVIPLLILIGEIRSEGSGEEFTFITWLLMKDYFPPAHMLFTAIAFDFIDPWEVVISNVSNSLILQYYPYLQQTVTELINPGLTTRNESYAFYIFTEGYLFLGEYGFFYNGVILILLLYLWRSLARTKDVVFNNFMLALLSSMLANLVRGQSSYFIKYTYTFIIPTLLIFLLLTRRQWLFKIWWWKK